MDGTTIIAAIDNSPLNRGLRGADWLASPGNIPILIEDDIALFDAEGGGTYQIHVLFRSSGKTARDRIKSIFSEMFEDRGADLIMGLAPDFRRDVKLMARWTGMKPIGKRATDHGICELYVLSKEMWKDNS
jgi:hypothetical protein